MCIVKIDCWLDAYCAYPPRFRSRKSSSCSVAGHGDRSSKTSSFESKKGIESR